MAISPGTQIGVDGRRVPIDELPTLSSEGVALDRRREAQAVAFGELVATTSQATERDSVAAPGTAAGKYDALEPDPALSVEVEADSTYHFELWGVVQTSADDAAYQLRLPDGASGYAFDRDFAYADGDVQALYDGEDASRFVFTRTPLNDLSPLQVVGMFTTVEAGTVDLAWGSFKGTADTATLLPGALLRLTKA